VNQQSSAGVGRDGRSEFQDAIAIAGAANLISKRNGTQDARGSIRRFTRSARNYKHTRADCPFFARYNLQWAQARGRNPEQSNVATLIVSDRLRRIEDFAVV